MLQNCAKASVGFLILIASKIKCSSLYFSDELISIFDGEDNSFVVDPDSIFPEDILYSSSLNRPVSRTGARAANNEG